MVNIDDNMDIFGGLFDNANNDNINNDNINKSNVDNKGDINGDREGDIKISDKFDNKLDNKWNMKLDIKGKDKFLNLYSQRRGPAQLFYQAKRNEKDYANEAINEERDRKNFESIKKDMGEVPAYMYIYNNKFFKNYANNNYDDKTKKELLGKYIDLEDTYGMFKVRSRMRGRESSDTQEYANLVSEKQRGINDYLDTLNNPKDIKKDNNQEYNYDKDGYFKYMDDFSKNKFIEKIDKVNQYIDKFKSIPELSDIYNLKRDLIHADLGDNLDLKRELKSNILNKIEEYKKKINESGSKG